MDALPHTRMSERSDRLRAAMKAAGLSTKEAVERFGWNRNTLKSNLNGSMDFSYNKAMVYAGRLKVRAEWLYSGEGSMKPEPPKITRTVQEIPVIGWVQAGALADIGQLEELDELDRLTVNNLPVGHYFATPVKGTSMDRVSPEGSLIIVNAADKEPQSGGYYLFSLRGETTYKRFYSEPVPRLEPFSIDPTHRPIFLLNDDDWVVVGRVVRSLIDLD